MSMAWSASTSMVSKVLQSAPFEELEIIVLAFLVAEAFRRACFGKQICASDVPKPVKLRPHRAEQTGPTKPPEVFKCKAADVTLPQSVTQNQQRPPTVSGSLGGEPAKKGSSHQRKLHKNGSVDSSGDPIKDALMETIKSFQSSCMEVWHTWSTFCESQEGNTRDPACYPVDVLQQFVDDHCCSQLCSAQRLLHCSTPAQVLAPCHSLSQKVELLIDCVRRGEDAIAITIFEEIRSTDENTDFADALKYGNHKLQFFDMLVQCVVRVGRTELIEVLFGDMNSAGVKRPLSFYERTIKMFASKKYYKEGMYVYSCLEADGLKPSPAILSRLICFAGELGQSQRAISFFDRLAACSTPCLRDYVAILSVHSRDHNWLSAIALLRDMQHRSFPVDSRVLNLVLSAGVAAGQLEGAEALLQEFSTTDSADVTSYNTVMEGFCRQKYGGQAIKMLNEMCQVGVKPNRFTFNTAMDAAIRSLRVKDARLVLARMVEAGLAPDKCTFTVLMRGIHRGATSKQLGVILDLMPVLTQHCNFISCAKMFRSVVEAIAQANNPDLAARAIAQMTDQRAMLPPEEYRRLLQVLSFDKDGNRVEHLNKNIAGAAFYQETQPSHLSAQQTLLLSGSCTSSLSSVLP